MKPAFACAASLLLCFTGVVTLATAQERVAARNDSAYPLRLSVDPATIADAAEDQSTFSLRLENTGSQPIVAFAIRYGQPGETSPTRRHAMTFFAAAKDRMIEPGGSRSYPQGFGLQAGERIEAQVDLIVFADGTAIGPNHLGETRIVQARLSGQRTVLTELLTRIQNRAPNPTIQKMVQDELAAFPAVIKHKRPGTPEDIAQAQR